MVTGSDRWEQGPDGDGRASPTRAGPLRDHRSLPPIHQPLLKKCSRWAGLICMHTHVHTHNRCTRLPSSYGSTWPDSCLSAGSASSGQSSCLPSGSPSEHGQARWGDWGRCIFWGEQVAGASALRERLLCPNQGRDGTTWRD